MVGGHSAPDDGGNDFLAFKGLGYLLTSERCQIPTERSSSKQRSLHLCNGVGGEAPHSPLTPILLKLTSKSL